MSESVLSEIRWPNKPEIDDEAWKRNLGIIRMLVSMGEVTQWQNGEGSCVPHHYNIDGVTVKFLPHWGDFYEVGAMRLSLPKQKEDVSLAVTAVKKLIELGLREKTEPETQDRWKYPR